MDEEFLRDEAVACTADDEAEQVEDRDSVENWEEENAVFQVEVREQKRASECSMEHCVDMPVSQIVEAGR